MSFRLLLVLLVAAAGGSSPLGAKPQHGLAMHGAPLLPADFVHFPYVNSDAPKGGRLRLGALGSFDSLNPFIVKGVTPPGLREYVFESLMARSQDEPFTLYGLIAATVELPDDRSSITFHLRPEARFSDGKPITADDVLFSHALLRDKGWPYHRSYYSKVARAEMIGARSVRFHFQADGDREIPLILGLMPVLPRHRFSSAEEFDRTTLEPAVGSGPYLVDHFEPGRFIAYRRNVDHWAKNLPVTRGRYNCDEIRYEFFRDASALFEAFKSGQIDVRLEDDPSRWAEGYQFPAAEDGRVVKREFDTGLPAGMSALVFNTRRPLFADPRIRRALILAFDSDWINRSLYHGLYVRTESFFQRSALAAGHPASERERALLQPFAQEVRTDVLDSRLSLSRAGVAGNHRDALREAVGLLRAAGYVLDGQALVHEKTGAPLSFEFLASTRAQERLMLSFAKTLERLGIQVHIRQVDSAQYWSRLKTFDFDMIQWTWVASLSPGNEQLNRWSTRSADAPGSLNYAGVRSPAADAMIEALLAADTREDFTAAVRALDRVLVSGDYVIPLFHTPKQWAAYWSHLRMPQRTALFGVDFDTWWVEEGK